MGRLRSDRHHLTGMTSTRTGHLVARHWLFTLLLLLGTALRSASSDGVGWTQLAGLVSAAAAYVVALRWGCWSWLAALAATPALLDVRMLDDQPGRLVLALLLSTAWVVLVGLAPSDVLERTPRSLPAAAVTASLVAGVVAFLLSQGQTVATRDPGVPSLHLSELALVLVTIVGLAAVPGVGRATSWGLWLATVGAVWAVLVGDGLLDVAWAPLAGALGLTALLRGRRGAGVQRPQADEVDAAALSAFRDRYGEPALGPVAIVIAAYNEAEGIPHVLETLPAEVCGLRTDVIVVDDGSSDGTADALERTRAHVVACPVNRGQGAALRLGYRVAREHGAAYVITTDADGQYDVADLPAVLTPILEGRADFVTGSRILGRQHTRDKVRRLGVHVFAWLATILTGHRLTDTSFGLRAARAEVTAAVTLNQPQYQSSELLLGVLSHGFRVLEVPGTMHVRAAGSTKKGRNLVYGRRYAGVMTGTWWREGCPRPVHETAPAFRHTRLHAVEGDAAG